MTKWKYTILDNYKSSAFFQLFQTVEFNIEAFPFEMESIHSSWPLIKYTIHDDQASLFIVLF